MNTEENAFQGSNGACDNPLGRYCVVDDAVIYEQGRHDCFFAWMVEPECIAI